MPSTNRWRHSCCDLHACRNGKPWGALGKFRALINLLPHLARLHMIAEACQTLSRPGLWCALHKTRNWSTRSCCRERGPHGGGANWWKVERRSSNFRGHARGKQSRCSPYFAAFSEFGLASPMDPHVGHLVRTPHTAQWTTSSFHPLVIIFSRQHPSIPLLDEPWGDARERVLQTRKIRISLFVNCFQQYLKQSWSKIDSVFCCKKIQR